MKTKKALLASTVIPGGIILLCKILLNRGLDGISIYEYEILLIILSVGTLVGVSIVQIRYSENNMNRFIYILISSLLVPIISYLPIYFNLVYGGRCGMIPIVLIWILTFIIYLVIYCLLAIFQFLENSSQVKDNV